MDTATLVLDFFAKNGKAPLPEGDAALAVKYLDAGIIDSLGIVIMISEIEGILGVQFSPDDMMSPEFQTVGGLIQIIDKLTAGAA